MKMILLICAVWLHYSSKCSFSSRLRVEDKSHNRTVAFELQFYKRFLSSVCLKRHNNKSNDFTSTVRKLAESTKIEAGGRGHLIKMCFLKLSKAEWDITSITSNIFHETSPSVFWDYMRPMSTQKILSHLKLISLNLSEKYPSYWAPYLWWNTEGCLK